jgi:hypothetical protein
MNPLFYSPCKQPKAKGGKMTRPGRLLKNKTKLPACTAFSFYPPMGYLSGYGE